jgi:hypothetical protein
LAKQDATIDNIRKQVWVFPTNLARQGNANYIHHLVKEPADQAAAGNRNNA